MVRKILVISLLLLVALAGCAKPAPANNLRIITEEDPPLNFTDERGNITGQSTEIVKEILKKTGDKANIEVMPWSDGYTLAQNEAGIVLYSTMRLPARESMFKWVGPIGFEDNWFYARRGSDITIASLDDAKKVKAIAVYKDDANQIYLSSKGFTNLDISNNDQECIKKLMDGKVDLWMGPSAGLPFIAYAAGINPAEIQEVSYVTRMDQYIAFNKNTSDKTIKAWQSALDSMKKAPDASSMSQYEKIITSYALPQYAGSTVTSEQVIQLVNTTVADLAADAPRTVSKINSKSAPYLDKTNAELYIYIFDTGVNEVANASNPAVVGRCFKGVPDIAGKLFRDDIVENAVKVGQGWEDYVFTMPGKVGLFYKSAYYKMAAGSDGKQYIVCSGLYSSAPQK